MGGDGTVTAVISNLLTKAQKDSGIDTRPDFRPTKLDVTIGIIPVGRYSIIDYAPHIIYVKLTLSVPGQSLCIRI